MKWKNVKDTVVGHVRNSIICCVGDSGARMLEDLVASEFEPLRILRRQDQSGHWHKVCELYADKATEIIDNWDIRCVGKLRDLFPGAFPPSLQKGRLVCELTDDGWEVLAIK